MYSVTGADLSSTTNDFESTSASVALSMDASFVAIPLHHSYLDGFAHGVDTHGLEGLYGETAGMLHQLVTDRAAWELVKHPNTTLLSLDPAIGTANAPTDLIGFTQDAPHRLYNWELFVHVPLRIAERLREQGHYADALRWLRFVMDPAAAAQPFSGEQTEAAIDEAWGPRPLWDPASFTEPALKSLAAASNPFDVHGVAENDPQVYRFAVARQYAETLIAWGDDLFSRDTMESIAEAIQIYSLAQAFLGERPQPVELQTDRGSGLTFAQLRTMGTTDDGLSNPLTEMENLLTHEESGEPTIRLDTSSIDTSDTVGYFCEPDNDRHVRLWDTLDDRLYKIRHCMNIDGVVRSLPIFEPPIDPGALVAAAGAGLDLSQLQPTRWVSPHVRFGAMLALARGLANSVQQLSSVVLQALQNRDGEALAVLRQQQEIEALELADDVRRSQLDEARLNRRSMVETRKATKARRDHYAGLLDEGLLPSETAETLLLAGAATLQGLTAVSEGVAATLATAPTVHAQAISSGVSAGGKNFAHSASKIGAVSAAGATVLNLVAASQGRLAGHTRRKQEWKLQQTLANRELAQIDTQLDALDARIEIANRELSNHRKQVAQSQEVDRMLRTKFTSEELYGWTVGQLTQLHSQTFQLALEVARKAEVCFRRELGLVTSSYIGASHWNASRKGLLAGNKLLADLERMEVAFVEQDRRELEITKHISMQRLDPAALLELRTRGTCTFSIPEVLFDLDFPGHYHRRIKGVTVSMPCVAGPYASTNAMLVLVRSEVRTDPAPDYADTPRTPQRWTERVALSSGQDDGGMFAFDLRDAKYLPFEHRGVVSEWTFELAGAEASRPQFDWNSISDLVLHIRYTARHDAQLETPASEAVTSSLAIFRDAASPLQLGLSFREGASDAWAAFLQQLSTERRRLEMTFDRGRLPYVVDAMAPTVRGMQVVLVCADPASASATDVHVGIGADGATGSAAGGTSAGVAGQPTASFDFKLQNLPLPSAGPDQMLAVELEGLMGVDHPDGRVDPTKLLDVVVLLDLEFAQP